MKLADSRGAYDLYSKTTSELNRKLAFAGIAIVWVFRSSEAEDEFGVTGGMLIVGVMFSLSLAVDLLHYWISAIVWGTFSRRKELAGTESNEDFLAPRWINWPGLVFWCSKVGFSLAAYVVLAVELLGR